MTFFLSKLFWSLAHPLSFSSLLMLTGIVWQWLSPARLARGLVVAGFLVLAVASFTPLGYWLIWPLEDRFPQPEALPGNIAGIIVLGGGEEPYIGRLRGRLELAAGGDRMLEGARLAARIRDIPLVFSGGTTDGVRGEGSIAAQIASAWREMGVPANRILLEDRSRNTVENAIFTRRIVGSAEGGRFLLITSAFHMPRAVGTFRRQGFDVVAWPVDYRSGGAQSRVTFLQDPLGALETTALAIKEWIGLFAYRALGRLDTLYPGPEPALGTASAVAPK